VIRWFAAALIVGAPLVGLGFASLGSPWLLAVAVVPVSLGFAGLHRFGWPASALALLVVVLAVTIVAAGISGLIYGFGVADPAGLCGGGRANRIVGDTAGFVVYGYLGIWSFKSPMRVWWALPLAAIAGVAAGLGVHALLPGSHGYCDT
jgi:hypothetical protein